MLLGIAACFSAGEAGSTGGAGTTCAFVCPTWRGRSFSSEEARHAMGMGCICPEVEAAELVGQRDGGGLESVGVGAVGVDGDEGPGLELHGPLLLRVRHRLWVPVHQPPIERRDTLGRM